MLKASASQTGLNNHLHECPKAEHILPYSNKLFQEAVTKWLIATDQVHHLTYAYFEHVVWATAIS